MRTEGKTLTEVLDALGYHYERANHGQCHVFKRDKLAVTGSAQKVWRWLRKTGQIGDKKDEET